MMRTSWCIIQNEIDANANRQKQRTLSDYWLGTPKTANQFEVLAESIDDENEEVSGEPAPTQNLLQYAFQW